MVVSIRISVQLHPVFLPSLVLPWVGCDVGHLILLYRKHLVPYAVIKSVPGESAGRDLL
ncbi:hypothetical protein LX36DRAFT_19454 [Colletotrichum falcatum]|nr:hypothetical protein LX36DRAFT_19454 [Colletotrichum falcatum]